MAAVDCAEFVCLKGTGNLIVPFILFAVIMGIKVLCLIFGNFRVCDLFVGWNPITHSSAVCSFVI